MTAAGRGSVPAIGRRQLRAPLASRYPKSFRISIAIGS